MWDWIWLFAYELYVSTTISSAEGSEKTKGGVRVGLGVGVEFVGGLNHETLLKWMQVSK